MKTIFLTFAILTLSFATAQTVTVTTVNNQQIFSNKMYNVTYKGETKVLNGVEYVKFYQQFWPNLVGPTQEVVNGGGNSSTTSADAYWMNVNNQLAADQKAAVTENTRAQTAFIKGQNGRENVKTGIEVGKFLWQVYKEERIMDSTLSSRYVQYNNNGYTHHAMGLLPDYGTNGVNYVINNYSPNGNAAWSGNCAPVNQLVAGCQPVSGYNTGVRIF